MNPFNWLLRLWQDAPHAVYGHCTTWTPGLVRYHLIGHLLIWAAYLTIPVVVLVASRRSAISSMPGRAAVLALLAAFVLSCGSGHLLAVVTVFTPVLRMEGHLLMFTALVSWLFVLVCVAALTRNPERIAEPSALALVLGRLVNAAAATLQEWRGILPPVAALAVVIIISTMLADQFVVAAEARYRVATRLRLGEEFLGVLRDAETGQRGFLLAGRPGPTSRAYLYDYDMALEREALVRRELQEAGGLTEELGKLADTKLAELANTVQLARTGQLDAALATVRSGAGLAMMQRIRQIQAADSLNSRSELEARVREVTRAGFLATRVMPVAGTASVVLVLTCFLALRRELSARRAAEQATVQAIAALQRSNADLEQFAYAASHDLQEPLRMISSFSQLIQKRYAGQIDDKADGWLTRVVDGAKRMQTTIDDLLAYARLATRVEVAARFRLEDVIREATLIIQQSIDETGATITVAPMPEITGDRRQWVLLIQNLLINAVKYRHPDRPPVISLSVCDGHILAVTDNGIGIDPMFHEKIFEMFTRVGSTRERGTGLGLALVRKVAERHGGRAWVSSCHGAGSTFHVALPVAGQDGTR